MNWNMLISYHLNEVIFSFLRTTSCMWSSAGMWSFCWNFSERQILWSLCSVDFYALALKYPIQTLHSVAPELQVFVSSLENCQNFSKTSTPLMSLDRAIHKVADLTVAGHSMIWLVLFHHSTVPSLKPSMGEQPLRVVLASSFFGNGR